MVAMPSLDNKFIVKSVVQTDQMKLTLHKEEGKVIFGTDRSGKAHHPLIISFIGRFRRDPSRAVKALVEQGGLKNEPAVIANVLFKTSEIDRLQLGIYLSKPASQQILFAYLDRIRLYGIEIDDALRITLGQVRLSSDAGAVESLLNGFCQRYYQCNKDFLGPVDEERVMRLVYAIMELNDALHSGDDAENTGVSNLFSFPNRAITAPDFIGAFRVRDPQSQISDGRLSQIYESIRSNRLEQARDANMTLPALTVTFDASRMSSRLTLSVMSGLVVVRIPRPDTYLSIRLLGHDLECTPNVLTFANSNVASFNITAHDLGQKSILFIKQGATASLYEGLPANKTLEVEKSFMVCLVISNV